MQKEKQNTVHTSRARAELIRRIVRLLRAVGDRELEIILAFVRALVHK